MDANTEAEEEYLATVSGYPQIGENGAFWAVEEAYRNQEISIKDLEIRLLEIRLGVWERLRKLGLKPTDGFIPLELPGGDYLAEMATTLGLIPPLLGASPAETATTYVPADTEGKWELGPNTQFAYRWPGYAEMATQARANGIAGRVVVPGVISFLLMSRRKAGMQASEALELRERILPAYREMLRDIARSGAAMVAMSEPALAVPHELGKGIDHVVLASGWSGAGALAAHARESGKILSVAEECYRNLGELCTQIGLPLMVDIPGGRSAGALMVLSQVPGVSAISIDITSQDYDIGVESLRGMAGKTLVAGAVEVSVWRTNLEAALSRLVKVKGALPPGAKLMVSTGRSLRNLPGSVVKEPEIDMELQTWLGFAEEKVVESVQLANALVRGKHALAGIFAANQVARASRATNRGVNRDTVRRDSRYTENLVRTLENHPRNHVSLVTALPFPDKKKEEWLTRLSRYLKGCVALQDAWVQAQGRCCLRGVLVWGDLAARRVEPADRPELANLLKQGSPEEFLAAAYLRADLSLAEITTQLRMAWDNLQATC